MIASYVEWLNSTGVGYVFVSGTTGSREPTTEERLMKKMYVDEVKKFGMKVIVHVLAVCRRSRMGQNAENYRSRHCGDATIFLQAGNGAGARGTHERDGSSAPSLPFYYYHIPSMNSVVFPMYDLVLEMEKNGAPNFAGIKYTGLYTHPSFMDVAKILGYKNNKYEVLSGRDEMMIEALASGITGFVGSQYNYAGDLYNSIRFAWQKGDIKRAREIQLTAINLLGIALGTLDSAQDGPKSVMSFVLPIGQARLPNLPVSADSMNGLKIVFKLVQNYSESVT